MNHYLPRREFFRLSFGMAVLAAGCAPAVLTTAPRRIAALWRDSEANNRADREAFVQGLGDFGWIEGSNIRIDWRFSDGDDDRFPALVAELIQLRPDVIVTGA